MIFVLPQTCSELYPFLNLCFLPRKLIIYPFVTEGLGYVVKHSHRTQRYKTSASVYCACSALTWVMGKRFSPKPALLLFASFGYIPRIRCRCGHRWCVVHLIKLLQMSKMKNYGKRLWMVTKVMSVTWHNTPPSMIWILCSLWQTSSHPAHL